jgi:hypothetical protein
MKKSRFWITALSFAFLSFIVLWIVLEPIFYRMPSSRVQALGYQVAGILTCLGIAGIAVGIKIVKKKPGLAAGLIGFFFSPLALGIATFIFGP